MVKYFVDQSWALSRPLVAYCWASAGPMQYHRQNILGSRVWPIQDHWWHAWWPALGQCKTIGSRLWGPVLGPCKCIGGMLWGQFWAQSRPLVACFGGQCWAHASPSVEYIGGQSWAHTRRQLAVRFAAGS